jgi:hypothetical protein
MSCPLYAGIRFLTADERGLTPIFFSHFVTPAKAGAHMRYYKSCVPRHAPGFLGKGRAVIRCDRRVKNGCIPGNNSGSCFASPGMTAIKECHARFTRASGFKPQMNADERGFF